MISNIELVSSYFERMTSRDIDGALALLNDEGTWWSNQRRTLIPMREFKKGAGPTLELMPMRFTVHSTLEAGDEVVMEIESHATRPNGDPYNNVYCFLFTLAEGSILHVRQYADTAYAADLPPEIKSLNKH